MLTLHELLLMLLIKAWYRIGKGKTWLPAFNKVVCWHLLKTAPRKYWESQAGTQLQYVTSKRKLHICLPHLKEDILDFLTDLKRSKLVNLEASAETNNSVTDRFWNWLGNSHTAKIVKRPSNILLTKHPKNETQPIFLLSFFNVSCIQLIERHTKKKKIMLYVNMCISKCWIDNGSLETHTQQKKEKKTLVDRPKQIKA